VYLGKLIDIHEIIFAISWPTVQQASVSVLL